MGEQIFFGILILVMCYLLFIILHPSLSLEAEVISGNLPDSEAPVCRQTVSIELEKETISAWLYLPEGEGPFPCVIMNTGFGGTKDVLLEPYALRFVEDNLATITFDYRYFGESTGEPRQLFDGIEQQEDLRAVIEFALADSRIDNDRIVIWSTSATGRYGINAASEDPTIAGVIAQCPSLNHKMDDGIIFKREGIGYFLKLFMHMQRDKGRSRLRLSPHRIPIVGKPGALAMMNAPGALEGYRELMAGSKTFVNGICARSLLIWPGPDAPKMAPKVQCPVLIQVCEFDTIVSKDSYKKVAEILGDKATIIRYPIGHFDIYKGSHFERAVEDQLAFLQKVFMDRPKPADP
jgi:pimeloyl-ACP methyl ester carboxylesterase